MSSPADSVNASGDDHLDAAASAMLHSRSRLQGQCGDRMGQCGQCTAGGHLARLSMEERGLVVMESPAMGRARVATATDARLAEIRTLPDTSGTWATPAHRVPDLPEGGGKSALRPSSSPGARDCGCGRTVSFAPFTDEGQPEEGAASSASDGRVSHWLAAAPECFAIAFLIAIALSLAFHSLHMPPVSPPSPPPPPPPR